MHSIEEGALIPAPCNNLYYRFAAPEEHNCGTGFLLQGDAFYLAYLVSAGSDPLGFPTEGWDIYKRGCLLVSVSVCTKNYEGLLSFLPSICLSVCLSVMF